ncbi:MAG: Uncharacterised protein [SAR116 cluster bacterium]|nr:MAG: Uncharacterised protein [SAR116 cluster bacterium]
MKLPTVDLVAAVFPPFFYSRLLLFPLSCYECPVPPIV